MTLETAGTSPVQTEAAQQAAAVSNVVAAPAGLTEGTADGGRTLSGRGEVYTFSTMYNVPRGYEEQGPYTIAIIRLDDGPMVTAQLTDVESADVRIGLRVEMVTRKLREDGPEGQIIYGYKFRPVLPRA